MNLVTNNTRHQTILSLNKSIGENGVGQGLGYYERIYRMDAFKCIARANVHINALTELRPWIESNAKPGLRLGHLSHLARDYAKPVLQSLIGEIKLLQNKSFNRVAS